MINDIDGAGYDFRACGHAVPCKCGEAMTNPPPPPASAMGLAQKWCELADACQLDGEFDRRDVYRTCAAALSLSEEEREALARADRFAARGDEILLEDYITLRALIARVTSIGEVK